MVDCPILDLEMCQKISDDLVVIGNEGLSDISGFENLTAVDGNVQIDNNGVEISVACEA